MEKVSADARAWRIAAYARLSREDGAPGASESIEGQLQMIHAWARKQEGATVVGTYVDDGYSGASFDRPGFRKMIEDAATGAFDTIVVKDLSRFGRSYLDCGSWIERDLPRMGVRLYSIGDDFDSMQRWSYDMALLVPMKNLMNEMQVISTSQKVRASLEAKRERGECVANFAPFGYAKHPADRHRLVVDSLAAEVVSRIFHMALGGKSASAIARALNAEGVPSPLEWKRRMGSAYETGFAGDGPARWHAETVLRILRNEVYAGTLVQGKTQRLNWRIKVGIPVAPCNWSRTSGVHDAIVSADLFQAVQALMRKRSDDPAK